MLSIKLELTERQAETLQGWVGMLGETDENVELQRKLALAILDAQLAAYGSSKLHGKTMEELMPSWQR